MSKNIRSLFVAASLAITLPTLGGCAVTVEHGQFNVQGGAAPATYSSTKIRASDWAIGLFTSKDVTTVEQYIKGDKKVSLLDSTAASSRIIRAAMDAALYEVENGETGKTREARINLAKLAKAAPQGTGAGRPDKDVIAELSGNIAQQHATTDVVYAMQFTRLPKGAADAKTLSADKLYKLLASSYKFDDSAPKSSSQKNAGSDVAQDKDVATFWSYVNENKGSAIDCAGSAQRIYVKTYTNVWREILIGKGISQETNKLIADAAKLATGTNGQGCFFNHPKADLEVDLQADVYHAFHPKTKPLNTKYIKAFLTPLMGGAASPEVFANKIKKGFPWESGDLDQIKNGRLSCISRMTQAPSPETRRVLSGNRSKLPYCGK